jgi:hypothetical protein
VAGRIGKLKKFVHLIESQITPTNRRDIQGFEELTLFSKTIQTSSAVKQLGLISNKGLTCKKQLNKVTNNAYRDFWTSRGKFGRTWAKW